MVQPIATDLEDSTTLAAPRVAYRATLGRPYPIHASASPDKDTAVVAAWAGHSDPAATQLWHVHPRLPPSPFLPPFAPVNESIFDFKAGPTLGVAVMAWLFGLAGTITILFLRSSVTSEQEGPFRTCMSGGGKAGGGSMGHNVGTV